MYGGIEYGHPYAGEVETTTSLTLALSETVTNTQRVLLNGGLIFDEVFSVIQGVLNKPMLLLVNAITVTGLKIQTGMRTMTHEIIYIDEGLVWRDIWLYIQNHGFSIIQGFNIRWLAMGIREVITAIQGMSAFKTLWMTLSNAVQLVQSFGAIAMKALSEVLTITTGFIRKTFAILSSSITTADVISYVRHVQMFIAEVINTMGNFVNTRGKNLAQSVVIIASMVRANAMVIPLQGLTITGVAIKKSLRVLTQTFLIVTGFIRDTIKVATEIITVTSNTTRLQFKALILEGVTLTTGLIFKPLKYISEVLHTTDLRNMALGRAIDETLSVIGVSMRLVMRSLSELVITIDGIIRKPLKVLAERVSWSMVFRKKWTRYNPGPHGPATKSEKAGGSTTSSFRL